MGYGLFFVLLFFLLRRDEGSPFRLLDPCEDCSLEEPLRFVRRLIQLENGLRRLSIGLISPSNVFIGSKCN